ncbi:MAG: DUF927 domain-containing protein [Janthinobacterium lividum]
MRTASKALARLDKIIENNTYYGKLHISGCKDLAGERILAFSYDDRQAWLKESECFLPSTELLRRLADQGIFLTSKEGTEALLYKLGMVLPSRHDAITGHPGREGFNYGLLNADIINPKRAAKVSAGYPAVPGKHALAGNRSAWQEGVGELVHGHELPMFAAMLALTSAVSEMLSIGEPTLVQIVGRPGSGRSDMLHVAASVSGSFLRGPLPFYEFLADPASIISDARGDILMVGDPCLAFSADPPARRQTATLALLRAWLGSRAGARVCLFSGDRPLAEWAEVDSEVYDLASRHVITLRIDESRPFGAFNNMDDDGAFALASSCRRQHARLMVPRSGPLCARSFRSALLTNLPFVKGCRLI